MFTSFWDYIFVKLCWSQGPPGPHNAMLDLSHCHSSVFQGLPNWASFWLLNRSWTLTPGGRLAQCCSGCFTSSLGTRRSRAEVDYDLRSPQLQPRPSSTGTLMGLSSGSAVEVSFRVIFSSLERQPWRTTKGLSPFWSRSSLLKHHVSCAAGDQKGGHCLGGPHTQAYG